MITTSKEYSMATNLDFIEYICDQIAGSGDIRYRKMFGEYMVYVNDRPLFLVCDNLVYVRMLEPLAETLKDADKGFPYHGAKEHYILDIDNRHLALQVVEILLPLIAIPQPKKKKKKT